MFAEVLEVGSVVRHKEQGFVGVVKSIDKHRATVVVTENRGSVDTNEYNAIRNRLEVVTAKELTLKTLETVVKVKASKYAEADSKLTEGLFKTLTEGLFKSLSEEQSEVTDADVIEVEGNGSVIRFHSYENFERFMKQMK